MSEHGTYLDCGCYIAPGGGRSWCPTCAGGGHKDTRDDTIRSLRLENGRLRWALADALWRWEQADPNNPQLPVDEAALSAPGDGLWQEVQKYLRHDGTCATIEKIARELVRWVDEKAKGDEPAEARRIRELLAPEFREREKAAWLACADSLRCFWGGSAGERTYQAAVAEAERRYPKEEKA